MTLKVWNVRQPEPPAPQLTVVDSTYSTGQFGLLATVEARDHSVIATFDDISFTPIPEPPGLLLAILGFLVLAPLALLRRKHARPS